MKKKKSGGKRAGSGRKPLYNEKTTPVQFECPVSKKDEFKANARELLKKYRTHQVITDSQADG